MIRPLGINNSEMAEASKSSRTSSESGSAENQPALLLGRYYIDANAPLPHLDSPSARAFSVEDRRDIGRNLFAFICTPELPPRLDVMDALKGEHITGLLTLVEWGTVFWPPLGIKIMVVVYEYPMGGSVIDPDTEDTTRIAEYDIPRRIVEPLATAIAELSARGIAHHSIRPDNVYFLDEECQKIVLGECVTGPPGFDQTALVEPMPRATSSPGGRGPGTTSDDLYALGVTIFVIITGHSSLENNSDTDIIYKKFEQGSYASICGQKETHFSLTEVFRGLLCDDPDEQWDLEKLDIWINGRQQPPIKNISPHRAKEPFLFNGYEHTNPKALAYAFSRNVRDAIRSIKDDEFLRWLRHSVGETGMADAVSDLLEVASYNKGATQGRDDYLVFRTVLILDPTGPLRFKDFSCDPNGFGTAIAVDLLRKGNAKAGIEVILLELFTYWIKAQPATRHISPELKIIFNQSRNFLKSKQLGYGIDRCLYKLNPGLPCQSSLISSECVISIEDLLPALDSVSANIDPKLVPIDRHIAAFIATRFDEDIQPHLRALASTKQQTSIVGMMSLLAFMQYKLHPEPLLGLAGWVGGLLGPVIDSYYSVTTRRKLERDIPKLVRKGSLPDLFEFVDDADLRRQDWDDYNEAKERYAEAHTEAVKIEDKLKEQLAEAETAGERVTAIISVLGTMVIVTMIFIGHYL